jgi:hypothetical protein
MLPSEREVVEARPLPRYGSALVPTLMYGTGLWMIVLLVLGAAGLRGAAAVPYMLWPLPVSMLLAWRYYLYRDRRERHREADRRRARFAADREAGQAEEWRVRVRDAILVHPIEDESSQFYLELEDGRVLFLESRFLDEEWHGQQFPNRELLITRLPHAGDVLNLQCLGECFAPSAERAHFTHAEYEDGVVPQDGQMLEGPLSRYASTAPDAKT